jgi:formate hydrogenlyase subunit 6/NADH:ubiquinone oxidoreductase subunit I
MEHNAYAVPNPITPGRVIVIDEKLCNGCNTCVNICRLDIMLPNQEKGKPPLVLYPDECWFCGCCASDCPTHALVVEYPLNQRVGWKRKDTGEYFRIGMKNPPPPNTRPAV